MNPFRTGLVVCCAACLTAVFCACQAHSAEPTRPNIVLILADDLGYSDLGCYGGEIKTPNLDRLAAGGIRFKQFYNTTRCCPSRASINTGLYPHQAGIGGMDGNHPNNLGYEGFLTDRCVTTAEVLKAAGYRTYMTGKWHMGNVETPIERGFDEYFGLYRGHSSSMYDPGAHVRFPADRPLRPYRKGEYYATDVFTDYALDFLAESRKLDADGKRPPFFLYIAHTAPHFPLHAPKEEIDKYAETYLQGWDKMREARYARMLEMGVIDGNVKLTPLSEVPKNWVNVQTGWADKKNPAWDTIDADRRADLARRMAIFAAMVDRMDQNIGRVIADLEKNGDLDNTLILFLSDNGACAEWDPWGFDKNSGPQNVLHKGEELENMGRPGTYHSTGSGWANAANTPWRLYKHYVHEGGIRTPLIAHWPKGIERKGAFESSVGHIVDFMPTFLELAGATYPKERKGTPVIPLEGRSLLPAFQGRQNNPRTLFWEHENNRGVREGDTKLVWVGERAVWELYDLKSDPSELNDLAEKRSETVAKMAEAWENWAEKSLVRKKDERIKADKTPGLKLYLDFTKDDVEDSSGKENKLTVHNALPKVAGGRKFDGESYIDIPHSEALHCVNTPWAVEAIVIPEAKNGVIVACGGSGVGYALALENGCPVFAVRGGQAVNHVTGEPLPAGKVTLRAFIDKQHRVSLSVDGQEVASKPDAAFVSRLPNEATQIGSDQGTIVLESALPNFQGVIESIKIFRETM